MRAMLCLIAVVACTHLSRADDFRRLGEGDRLIALAELETKPFPVNRLASLQGWSGEPITPQRLEGRVLVLLAWENDEARSVRLLPKLARLERESGEDVLLLALHGAEGWDDAKDRIDAGRVRCTVAHDAGGELTEAMRVDEHPNLYIIDRAGMVRVADIDPRDLKKAIRLLSRETAEQARADLPNRIRRLSELRELLAPPEPTPTEVEDKPRSAKPIDEAPVSVAPEAYLRATWPSYNIERLNARNLQGRLLPVPLGNETWLTPKPERPVEQHVIVLDFWATWCGPCIRASTILDALQKKHRDELMVLAISGQSKGTAQPENEASIKAFIRDHPVTYSHLNDLDQSIYRRLAVRGIPHVVVLSTDGVIRWQGNPHSALFVKAVEQVVGADPLLAARRTAGDDED